MRYAIILNGEVVNVALWDGVTDWQPEGELVQLEDGSPVGPGWTYSDGVFVEPEVTA